MWMGLLERGADAHRVNLHLGRVIVVEWEEGKCIFGIELGYELSYKYTRWHTIRKHVCVRLDAQGELMRMKGRENIRW